MTRGKAEKSPTFHSSGRTNLGTISGYYGTHINDVFNETPVSSNAHATPGFVSRCLSVGFALVPLNFISGRPIGVL
ncbi:hypothetical protein [Arcticibacter sp.]|uniref:hypothetical protein n=1 Tax=Arcticibacter sp. TaxID=1872630 RepID=UPI00388EFEC4